jgi:hypothetical protein
VIMEYESQSFSWPAALASWLARLCSGSNNGDDGEDEPVVGNRPSNRPTGQMVAAAKHSSSVLTTSSSPSSVFLKLVYIEYASSINSLSSDRICEEM